MGQAYNEELIYETTITISVQENDTLWEIASELNNGSYDNRLLVNKIKEMNNLDSAVIRAGQKLFIPLI
ncbi:MAG: LysM peptidoglycan-binding domain-containing protein [Eubacteriales bacterium]